MILLFLQNAISNITLTFISKNQFCFEKLLEIVSYNIVRKHKASPMPID